MEETQIRHDYFDMKKADKGERMLVFVANLNSPQVEETWMDDACIAVLSDLEQRLACDCECLAEPVDACHLPTH